MVISKKYTKTIVIVGPTGSGKTGVGIEIAKEVGGEIISADSRAIYKGMDIGTAKPSLEEQDGVPHWGIDLVEPGERFTVADWKAYAEQKIQEIRARGKVPMVVGGTGLYVDALVYNYQFTEEAKKSYADRKEIGTEFLMVGIKWTDVELRERLVKRVNKLFNKDLYKEVKEVVKKHGWDNQAMKSIFYQFVWQYLRGECSLEEAKEKAVLGDWHLAKRQMTWFKRNPQIVWLKLAEIKPYVLKCIQDEQRK